MTEQSDSIQFCENHLRGERDYNAARSIWPSVNRVISRVLDRRIELHAVYSELTEKLHPSSVKRFLTVTVEVLAIWSPQFLDRARAARQRHEELRNEIYNSATQLAELLRERTNLGETSGFSTDGLFHVVDVMDRASQTNGHYTGWVQEKLQILEGQFDLKYWPSIPEMLDVIAEDALATSVQPTDSITEAATSSPKRSRADAFRALRTAIANAHDAAPGSIPRQFRLSDESYASLLNVILDLNESNCVDGAYVKRLRQRDRMARQP